MLPILLFANPLVLLADELLLAADLRHVNFAREYKRVETVLPAKIEFCAVMRNPVVVALNVACGYKKAKVLVLTLRPGDVARLREEL